MYRVQPVVILQVFLHVDQHRRYPRLHVLRLRRTNQIDDVDAELVAALALEVAFDLRRRSFASVGILVVGVAVLRRSGEKNSKKFIHYPKRVDMMHKFSVCTQKFLPTLDGVR